MDTRAARPRRRTSDLLDGWWRITISVFCLKVWLFLMIKELLAAREASGELLWLLIVGVPIPIVWWLAIKTLCASFADRAAVRAERMDLDFSPHRPEGTTEE